MTIVRGINLQVPSGYSPTAFETYVIIEFPYPAETPPQARTRHTVGSANAEYADPPHKFPIRRNDTKLRRLLSRKELKLSIYYRAGFLRADRLLGVAFVKLSPLEECAIIHESVDIYENEHRKKPHGKLEVKIRIREGLGPSKASELSPQRWLFIDRFDDVVNILFFNDRINTFLFIVSSLQMGSPHQQSKCQEIRYSSNASASLRLNRYFLFRCSPCCLEI